MWASTDTFPASSHLEVFDWFFLLPQFSTDSESESNELISVWLHRHLERGAVLLSLTEDLRALTLPLHRLVPLTWTTVSYLAPLPHPLLQSTIPPAQADPDLWRLVVPSPIPVSSAAPETINLRRPSLTHRMGWLASLCRLLPLIAIASPSPFGFARWGTLDLGPPIADLIWFNFYEMKLGQFFRHCLFVWLQWEGVSKRRWNRLVSWRREDGQEWVQSPHSLCIRYSYQFIADIIQSTHLLFID